MEFDFLKYRVFGEGHPVLFLHGFLESKSMWLNLDLEAFNFKSIIIDLPGHGESEINHNGEPSIRYMASKVLEIIHELKIHEFSIVGHSMGGYVALEIKKLFSDNCFDKETKCCKIVLLNSNFWEDSESKKKDRLRVVEIVLKNKGLFIREAIPSLFCDKIASKNEIEELIQSSLNMDKYAISYASLAMRNRMNQNELLINYSSDFLIIQGELDVVIPLELMKESLKNIDVKLKTISNVGHMAHIESTKEVECIISDFLIDFQKE